MSKIVNEFYTFLSKIDTISVCVCVCVLRKLNGQNEPHPRKSFDFLDKFNLFNSKELT